MTDKIQPTGLRLPATSYAILGMLAVRPWSAYELTKQIRRSLEYCWPKAESVLYDEPKRLTALGLTRAYEQPIGRRTRSVYEITNQGREALRAWLATEPAPPRLEIEPILRLLFADHGTKQDALRAVRALQGWARERIAFGLAQLQGYQDGDAPFPDRLHINALFARFYADLFDVMNRWADLAEREIQAWPRTDGLGMTPRSQELINEIITRASQLGYSASTSDTLSPDPPTRVL